MTTPLYTWSGAYCGFIRSGRIFDSKSNYLGWLDNDGRAFKKDGSYWGELSDGNYLLIRNSMIMPMNRIPCIPPIPPIPPIPKMNRAGRIPRAGYSDALRHLA